MGIEQAITRPARCVLVNVATAEAMDCLFNPTQLVERLQVSWNRVVVPGLSHQVLQYLSTGNRQLTGVEFYLDRLFAAAQPGHPTSRERELFANAGTCELEQASIPAVLQHTAGVACASGTDSRHPYHGRGEFDYALIPCDSMAAAIRAPVLPAHLLLPSMLVRRREHDQSVEPGVVRCSRWPCDPWDHRGVWQCRADQA
jgi:hypothetical protein